LLRLINLATLSKNWALPQMLEPPLGDL
jgi:hypothetical protein